MVWFIAKKEFRNNILTPGFIVGLLLCLALIPYTVYEGTRTHSSRLAQFGADVKEAMRTYDEAPVYSHVQPVLVKPVSALSIFCKGISEQTGSKVYIISKKEKPTFSSGIVSLNRNPFMNTFMSLDFTMALAILLSLLGILFSYDMLSREKEQGTLKLALSHPVSRSTFFLGKIAGVFLTLLPILVICFLVVLLIIQFSPSIRFSTGEYGRIVALLLLSLLYFGFFVFLGGFISSHTGSSTSSIILNLFIWCFLLFLLPNIAACFGKNITPAGDYKQMNYSLAAINNTWRSVHQEEVEAILSKEFQGRELGAYYNSYTGDWDGIHLVMYGLKSLMEYERRKKELVHPIMIKACNDKWAIQSEYLQRLYRQEKTVRYLSYLSPAGIFKHIASVICRTGSGSEIHFMNQARQFHDTYFGYFEQTGLFYSYAYFTVMDENEFTDDVEYVENLKYRFETEHSDLSYRDYINVMKKIDTSHLPRFTYTPPTLGNDLFEQLWLIAGIFIAYILLFWLSFVSFIKYDVR
jgi:ABC-type transport system involved in multi-copper enzyme maturation permease subunit